MPRLVSKVVFQKQLHLRNELDASPALVSVCSLYHEKNYEIQSKVLLATKKTDMISKITNSVDNKKVDTKNTEACTSTGNEKKMRKNFFPFMLWDILSINHYYDVVSWTRDGKAFVIKDVRRFSGEILTHHFYKTGSINSFIRKLNRWGFKMAATGKNTGAYMHALFVRDEPWICIGMKCKANNVKKIAPIATGKVTLFGKAFNDSLRKRMTGTKQKSVDHLSSGNRNSQFNEKTTLKHLSNQGSKIEQRPNCNPVKLTLGSSIPQEARQMSYRVPIAKSTSHYGRQSNLSRSNVLSLNRDLSVSSKDMSLLMDKSN